jgi:hypothetical protein
LQRRITNLGLMAAPPLLALLAVFLEPWLTTLTAGREATLPLILFVVLASLLHPRIRTLMITTLCFGVAFMALRDAWSARSIPLPPSLDYVFVDALRPAGLLLVAALAGAAAVGETLNPGTVWARRCYFGAAALYFLGTGVINYGWHGSWRGLLLCITGAIALFGCLIAPRIIASEQEAEEEAAETVNDETLQYERDLMHRNVLRAKEWHDTLPLEGEERTRNSPNAAPS